MVWALIYAVYYKLKNDYASDADYDYILFI